MIKKLEIRGVHFKINPKLMIYTTKRIGRLDHYVSKHARESMHAEVILKEEVKDAKKSCICEAVIYLPHGTLAAKEATINIYAAIDIVETKLKNQLKKYKSIHGSPKLHQRVISRFKRSSVED